MSRENDRQNSENVRLQGNKLFKQKKYQQAISKYTTALKLNPQCHLSLSNRCQCYIMLNNAPKALQEAQKVVELKNDWAKGWFRLGVANEISKNFEHAANAFFKAYQLDNTLEVAKARYESAKLISNMSPEILQHMKNGQLKNMSIKQLGQMAQNDPSLMKHVQEKINAKEQIAHDPKVCVANVYLFIAYFVCFSTITKIHRVQWKKSKKISSKHQKFG